MKTVFLLLSINLALNSFCQINNKGIILNKGQNFSVQTTSTQDTDMGMGMEMKNFSTSNSKFIVLDASEKSYMISSALTRIKFSMDAMGQQTNYDSDLKSDNESEIGKSIKNLNVPDTLSVNKYTAEISSDKKTDTVQKDISNPMESLFESLGDRGTNMSLSDAFIMIPAGKKIGDNWSDSSSTKDQKTFKTYTLQSIEKNIATIIVIGNVVSNIQTETNGMQLVIEMTTKSNTEIVADKNTSLVIKRNTKADITGTLEMMGQSLPISGKSTTTSVYEY